MLIGPKYHGTIEEFTRIFLNASYGIMVKKEESVLVVNRRINRFFKGL